MMKAVFLDCIDINRGDLSWEPVEDLCEFKWFLTSTKEGVILLHESRQGLIQSWL